MYVFPIEVVLAVPMRVIEDGEVYDEKADQVAARNNPLETKAQQAASSCPKRYNFWK